MRQLSAPDLLALWERGAQRHALDRTALLCAWARPDLPADGVADLPLGAVTTSLLQLRESSFGTLIQGHVDCRCCGQRLALELQVSDLLQPTPSVAQEVELLGLRVRAPSLRDLADVAAESDAESATRRLLARCTLQGVAATLDDEALQQVEDTLDALDPNADLALEVHCEACGRSCVAQLDAGVLLWDEIEAHARALLGEVHTLARAYGWTEGEILSLSAARRATYLAIASA